MNDKDKKKDGPKPIRTFRRGAIAANVWKRQTATGFEYLEYSLSRSWKTKDGKKEGYSSNFHDRNVDQLIEVIHEATAFIREYGSDAAPQAEQLNGTEHAAA